MYIFVILVNILNGDIIKVYYIIFNYIIVYSILDFSSIIVLL